MLGPEFMTMDKRSKRKAVSFLRIRDLLGCVIAIANSTKLQIYLFWPLI